MEKAGARSAQIPAGTQAGGANPHLDKPAIAP